MNAFIKNIIKFNLFYLECLLLNNKYNLIKDTYYYSLKPKSNAKIAIYGFGPYGEKCFLELFPQNTITNVYDIKFCKIYNKIKHPNDIHLDNFDYIVITVMNNIAREQIINFLEKKGIATDKILYLNYKYNRILHGLKNRN